jgi:hypothetical protein
VCRTTRQGSPIQIVWLGVVLLGLLVGCVRPIEEEQTATPPGDLAVSNPGVATSTVPTVAISTPTPRPPRDLAELTPLQERSLSIFIANNLGEAVQEGTFSVYGVYSTRTDDEIYGMTFLNPSSLPCVAALLVQPNPEGGLNYLVGDKQCATELGADAVVTSILLVSGNESYIATFGQVLRDVVVNEILIAFPDGATSIVGVSDISQNRFLHVRPTSFVEAEQVSFFDNTSTLLLEIVP